MEVEHPVVPFARTMLRQHDPTRIGRPLRPDESERPKATNENVRAYTDSGPGPATLENTPPRADDRPKGQQGGLSREDTTKLFERKIEDARKETNDALAGDQGVTEVVKPTLTLDLGRQSIVQLPEAVIDLVKNDVERLSLSHNQLTYLPLRIAECTQLRYLNIRTNKFREIPKGIYQMPLLEILDVSRNRINRISKEVKKLESLRVLSVQHNNLKDLPAELCELVKLRIIKIAENPIRGSLKEIIDEKESEIAYAGMMDNEKDAAMTMVIMRYLRSHHTANISTPVLDASDFNDSPVETPKLSRRALSGRFPVVPAASIVASNNTTNDQTTNTTDSPPNPSLPPSIPTKSHLRGISGHNIAVRRPGIAPLISGNERNRSNSESVLQASAAARQKRVNIMRKERSDLDSIDETKVVRQSHLRGFSYGSAVKRNGSISSPGGVSTSPSSPKDVRKQPTKFVRRLSSLPEHKGQSEVNKPVIEGAKSILYSLYQIHPQIAGLIEAIKDKDVRRSSLEMAFYNASTQIDRLNTALELANSIEAEDEERLDRTEETVHRDCVTCVNAFVHVVAQMQGNVSRIVEVADPRYIRTLMLLLYGSIMEIKNAMKTYTTDMRTHRRHMSSGTTHPIQTIPEEATTPQGLDREQSEARDENAMTIRPGLRLRSDTVLQIPSEPLPSSQPGQQAPIPSLPTGSNLDSTGSYAAGSYSRTSSATGSVSSRSFGPRSRSNSRHAKYAPIHEPAMPSTGVPLRATETYQYQTPPSSTRINPATGMTEAQEEACFEQIFLSLTKSYETALQALPIAQKRFQMCLENAEETRQRKEIRDMWLTLVRRCKACEELSVELQVRLGNIKAKDTGFSMTQGGRTDASFWILCKTFIQSFVDLVTEMRDAKGLKLLPQDILIVLRPVQKSSKEAGRLIETSPWRYLTESGVNMSNAIVFNSTANDGQHPQQLNNFSNHTNGMLNPYNTITSQHHTSQTNSNLQNLINSTNLAPPPLIPLPPIPVQSPSVASSSASPVSAQLPATPLSAALGPAVQATVPSTPASAYGDSFFKGDVFQRADSLLSMPQAAGSVNFLNRR